MKLLLIIGFFALIACSNAFKCYQCEYYENSNVTQSTCDAEKVPDEFLKDCIQSGYDGDSWQCVKKTGKTIDEDDNEYKYVRRFCSAGATYDNTCKESDALGSDFGTVEGGFLCYCNSENCNAAGHLEIQGTLVAIISSMIAAFQIYN